MEIENMEIENRRENRKDEKYFVEWTVCVLFPSTCNISGVQSSAFYTLLKKVLAHSLTAVLEDGYFTSDTVLRLRSLISSLNVPLNFYRSWSVMWYVKTNLYC